MLLRTLLALPVPLADRVERLLDTRDVSSLRVREPGEIWRALQCEDVDLVVIGASFEARPPEEWARSVRALPDAPDFVFLTEGEDPSLRAALLEAGAHAVLNPRLSDRELRGALRTLVARIAQARSTQMAAQRIGDPSGFEDITSRSLAMRDVIATARRVAGADSSLLILGETGVGKERLARSIHRESGRSAGPFVPVNCGAIPEGLLESELFGHERGAFTDAVRARRGHFEMAHRGTLFLDEIGEIPHHLQVKLLRILEDHMVHRLGSERGERVDVRIIAATNRDLEAEVTARRFRADLYYRLAVVTLHIPPLRQRPEDIPDLIDQHLTRFRSVLGRPVEGVDPEALATLLTHDWPGNVRELINVLERAVLLSTGPRLAVVDLPRSLTGLFDPTGSAEPAAPEFDEVLLERPIREARRAVVGAFERWYLDRLLATTTGRIGDAATRAGITERSLYDLLKKADLRKAEYRHGSGGRR